jgi:release factor glutamine methyltransferase
LRSRGCEGASATVSPRPASAPHRPLIELTEVQRHQIREVTGREVFALWIPTEADEVSWPFGELELRIQRGVFLPHPPTLGLIQLALDHLAGRIGGVAVDVGTGSGAAALTLARRRPDIAVYATDTSRAALNCAKLNRQRLGTSNVRFHEGSLLDALPRRLLGRVDVVLANLPYVPPGDAAFWTEAAPPGTALGGGDDGLDLLRALARSARDWLVPGGLLAVQLAAFQWPSFASELRRLGYQLVAAEKRDANCAMAAAARRPQAATSPRRSR